MWVSSLAVRIWRMLQEPRVVTALTSVLYGLLAVSGVLAVILPPATLALSWGPQTTTAWAVILLIGGTFACAGCLVGLWWLETTGIWLIWLALAVDIVMLSVMHIVSDSNWSHHAVILAALAVSLAPRAWTIRGIALDPSRRPRGMGAQ